MKKGLGKRETTEGILLLERETGNMDDFWLTDEDDGDCVILSVEDAKWLIEKLTEELNRGVT